MTHESLSSDEQRRYLRQTTLSGLGEPGQLAIKRAKVLFVGAGGLGTPALSYLAAAGVGTIGIADFDRVDLSNLPRQILFESADVGRRKADAARDRLQELNPHVRVVPIPDEVTEANIEALIEDYDIVADGSDNFITRFAVSAACGRVKKPLVSGTVQSWEGSISLYTPYADLNQPCYRCLVNDVPAQTTTCQQVGVLGPAAGIIGCMMAQEVLKLIMGIASLHGRLLHYDARNAQFKDLKLQKNPNCPQCKNPD